MILCIRELDCQFYATALAALKFEDLKVVNSDFKTIFFSFSGAKCKSLTPTVFY